MKHDWPDLTRPLPQLPEPETIEIPISEHLTVQVIADPALPKDVIIVDNGHGESRVILVDSCEPIKH